MVSTANIQEDLVIPDIGDIAVKRQWIKEQLRIGGVSETDADSRVVALTDSQVIELYQRIDEQPAGGNVAGGIILLLVLFWVLCPRDYMCSELMSGDFFSLE